MDLTRIDASDNLYRFYRMENAHGLFGDWALVREAARPSRTRERPLILLP